MSKDVLDALNRALDAFLASREREGAALAKVLLGYCDNIEGIARDIASRLPDILAAMKSNGSLRHSPKRFPISLP